MEKAKHMFALIIGLMISQPYLRINRINYVKFVTIILVAKMRTFPSFYFVICFQVQFLALQKHYEKILHLRKL